MKKQKNTSLVQIAGTLATIVFLLMALKTNDGWALLLVGSFALICLRLTPAKVWFQSFGIKKPLQKKRHQTLGKRRTISPSLPARDISDPAATPSTTQSTAGTNSIRSRI